MRLLHPPYMNVRINHTQYPFQNKYLALFPTELIKIDWCHSSTSSKSVESIWKKYYLHRKSTIPPPLSLNFAISVN